LLPAEYRSLNQSGMDYPREKTIPQLFAEQVERTPNALALVAGGVRLTYRELNLRSNRLAHRLQRLGIQGDGLVGVATERSEYMVIAMLAILKAGGAYVPLDPEYPGPRVSSMVEDSGLSLILTTAASKSKLPPTPANFIVLDEESGELSNELDSPFSVVLASSNLAYVIYTSGSTGKPKGVMIEHRNVVNFFSAMDRLIGVDAGVWLAVTSMAFDISVLELLWTLTRGFTIVLHSGQDPRVVAKEIREFGVTHMQSTPSLARILALDSDVLAALGSLKMILLGGEALPASLVSRLRTVFSGRLFNMYGPTETTIWSTAHEVTQHGNSIPIGVPIGNNFVYLLDDNLQPVKAGEVGNLYIGGEGVVRGYLNKPQLTAERFLPDPFSSGGRMYWTGDVARLLPDGNIDFLGRTDHQVKIRGFRIELGEIESLLETLPEVHQAVVIAREDKPVDIRLVAYIVPSAGAHRDADSLRTFTRSKLPEFMAPSQFVFLETFPLTSNGKIDRKALPAPAAQPERPTEPAEQPATELESILVELFSEALGISQVPLNANFFDLGAHSLLIAELHSRLQDRLGREVSLVDLFEFPTVSSLARHLGGEELAATAQASASSRAQRRREARAPRGE